MLSSSSNQILKNDHSYCEDTKLESGENYHLCCNQTSNKNAVTTDHWKIIVIIPTQHKANTICRNFTTHPNQMVKFTSDHVYYFAASSNHQNAYFFVDFMSWNAIIYIHCIFLHFALFGFMTLCSVFGGCVFDYEVASLKPLKFSSLFLSLHVPHIYYVRKKPTLCWSCECEEWEKEMSMNHYRYDAEPMLYSMPNVIFIYLFFLQSS